MINNDRTFMDLAIETSKGANCIRRQSGCVFVKDNKVLSTGHNGAPDGLKSCVERGECLRTKLNIPSGSPHDMCFSVCAEQKAIINALKKRKSLKDSVAYVTFQPCPICAKQMIHVGVKKVIYLEKHPNPFAAELFADAGVELLCFKDC